MDDTYYDSQEFLEKERESEELEEKTLNGESDKFIMTYPGLSIDQVLQFREAIFEAGGINNLDVVETLKEYLDEDFIRKHYAKYINDDSDYSAIIPYFEVDGLRHENNIEMEYIYA